MNADGSCSCGMCVPQFVLTAVDQEVEMVTPVHPVQDLEMQREELVRNRLALFQRQVKLAVPAMN